ncbi:hypothetical protein EDB85DRAFT_2027604 [Lactarius pseudohatsudake]|nr:hypothetical protein EDB85DRAFT_2027604 [Lactarius pseudohatsudake]
MTVTGGNDGDSRVSCRAAIMTAGFNKGGLTLSLSLRKVSFPLPSPSLFTPIYARAFPLRRTLRPMPPRACRRRTHLTGRPRRRYRRLPLSDSFAARGAVDGDTHGDEGEGEDEGGELGDGSVLSHAGRARVRCRVGAGPRVAGVRPGQHG